jgi:hypothetical protein
LQGEIATSRRNKKQAEAIEAVPAPSVGPGPELLRRSLLSLITALVVARPFVPGEDPGRTLIDTGAGNQVLTFLWFIALIGWGAWRAWSQNGSLRFSLVEVGLLAVALLSFVSARDAAAFKHPAWLISWEWLGLFAAFFLVRQLVRTPRENQALLAAVLATGVSLAAYAIYQAVVPPPALPTPDPTLAQIFDLPTDDLEQTESVVQPAAELSATFGRANTLAGFFLLLLPALFVAGFQLSSFRSRKLILLLVVLIGFILAAGSIGHLPRGLGTPWDTRAQRTNDSLRLVGEHPWKGVGPGNFGRDIGSYTLIRDPDIATGPQNFLLEIATTNGLLGLAALLVALGAYFYCTHVASRRSGATSVTAENESLSPEPPWEFYTGGIFGLTLGFMLALPEPGKADLLREGIVAACRSLIWFASFALLLNMSWTPRALAASTTTGVAALLIYLLFCDGISFPSLTLPMLVLMAIALNTLDAGWTWQTHNWIALVLPMPLLAMIALTFGLLAFHPAVSSSLKVAEARRSYPVWRDELEPLFQQRLKEAKDPTARYRAVQLANGVLWHRILGPLRRAALDDPGNPYVLSEAAYWLAKEWQILNEMKVVSPDDWVPRERGTWPQDYKDALDGWNIAVKQAQKADPTGKEAYWVTYLCRDTIFSEGVKKAINEPAQTEQDVRLQLTFAANNLDIIAEQIDPTNPRLRWLLAELLFRVNDKSAPGKAKEQAREAQRLNEETTDPRRKLTRSQEAKLQEWLFTDKKP